MTQSQYLIKRKLNILELGATLCSISEACRKLGVSRQHYYDIKSALEEEGLEGLLEKSRKAPRLANRVASEIEQKVLGPFSGVSHPGAGAGRQRAEETGNSNQRWRCSQYLVAA